MNNKKKQTPAEKLEKQREIWKNAYEEKKEPQNPNVTKGIQDPGSQVWFDNTPDHLLIKMLNNMVMDGLIQRHEARPVIENIVAGKRGAVPDFPFHKAR